MIDLLFIVGIAAALMAPLIIIDCVHMGTNR
jgi:hypothetical protein